MKNISCLAEKFQFLEVKFSIYLNRHVLVIFFLRWLGKGVLRDCGVSWVPLIMFFYVHVYTVNSWYLEVQGTL